MNDRDLELHALALRFHSIACRHADEAYWRGYSSGISRRLAGGASQDDLEVVAFDLLRDLPDGFAQILGQGYKDGFEGKAIEWMMPELPDGEEIDWNKVSP